jgi:hypothetical protein
LRDLRPGGAATLGDARGLGAHLSRVGGGARQRAVGVRDRAFRVAQRIACFLGGFFFLLKFAVDRIDAPAQRFEIFFLTCAPGCSRNRGEKQ